MGDRDPLPGSQRTDDPLAPRAMLFQDGYAWLVLISALDILFTWTILNIGGEEVNFIARAVIRSTGLWGMLIFKFAIVALVVVICEEVGRRRRQTGVRLVRAAVVLSCLPVAVGMVQVVTAARALTLG